MTSIKDIPFEDVESFLSKNHLIVPDDKNESYKLAFNLLKKQQKYYPDSVVEWIIAYNLLKSNVDIPTYKKSTILNLNEPELLNLSKLLTMTSKNKDHMVNILKYLHKLDDDSDITTLTKNIDTDMLLLEIVDNKTLNNLEINSYTKKILDDDIFWKKRLEKRLGLFSDDSNLDYKFITKFLDNSKSFEENYKESAKLYNRNPKKYLQIMKIIDDNKAKIPSDISVKHAEHLGILLSIYEDDEFDSALPYRIKLDSIDLDEIIYASKNLRLMFLVNYDDDQWVHIDLISENGYTPYKIIKEYISYLYKIMSNREYRYDDLHDMYGNHTNFKGIKWEQDFNAYYIELI